MVSEAAEKKNHLLEKFIAVTIKVELFCFFVSADLYCSFRMCLQYFSMFEYIDSQHF